MSIQKIGSDQLRPSAPRSVDAGGAREWGDRDRLTAADPRPERSDEVHISPEGRELAARMGEGDARSATWIDEVRARVESGHYDTPSVAHEVARRILASGDL